MDITIRHLSGSQAGQEKSFPQVKVTLGRNPSNDVAFDPQADSVVSGQHAEISPRHDGWMLRDLGSSNGTFINDERVTERLLRPGEVVQLGKNGPRLQISYELPQGVQTPSTDFNSAPAEGRTVMMMMNEGAPASAGYPAPAYASQGVAAPTYTPAAPARKKGGLLRALLVVMLLFGLLTVAGVVGYAFLVGAGDGAETAQTATTSGGTETATTTATSTAANMGKSTAAMSTAAPVGAIPTTTAATGTLATGTAAVPTTTSSAAVTGTPSTGTQAPSSSQKTSSDLEQQLAKSQQLIDGLQRELQQKNDTLQKTILEKDAAIRDKNAALRRARAAEARAQSQSQLLPALRRAKPVQIAGMFPDSILLSMAMQTEANPGGSGQLAKNKYLKKRIAFVYEEPEIQLPEMPSDMPAGIGALIIQALSSTGKYVASDGAGDAGISVVVTNYKSDVKTRVNTEAVTGAVGALSGIFGGPSVTAPASAKSISMNADMTARVRLMDPNSVELGQTFPEARSSGRRTSADLGGLAVNEIASTDTALGDVTRKVAADAVDYLLKELESVEWQGWITENDQEAKTLTVNCGARCMIEAGDVFGIYNGVDRVGAAKITRVTPDSASARITEGDGGVAGMSVQFEGRVGESPMSRKSQQLRTLRTRAAVQAFVGPGTTFAKGEKLAAGKELSLLYSLSTWAKVSDGSRSFWIPLSAAQITG